MIAAYRFLAFLILASLPLGFAPAAWGDDGPLTLASFRFAGECEEEAVCSYGPCDCEPRGTLFQWSYGTSFSGGPARDEPLVTDRPDFTESSVTVGRRVLQIEMGYTYQYDSAGGTSVRTHTFPETLVRYGILAEWLELRIGWTYAEERTRTGAMSSTLTGAEDLSLGFKIALTPQEGILPETALIPQFSVPTGSAPFQSDEVLPGVNYSYSWELSECLGTAGNSQVFVALDEVTGEDFVVFAQSWTVAASVTENVGAYAEWFSLFPSGADTATPEHFVNGGFTFLLNDDLQLDFRGGLGLNSDAADEFFGAGVSMRF